MTLEPIQSLITECRRGGIDFTLDGPGFKCFVPRGAMTAELRSTLEYHRQAIRDFLLAEGEAIPDAKPGPVPIDTDSRLRCEDDAKVLRSKKMWSADIAAAGDFVQLLIPDDLPTVPFEFAPGHMVIDRSKWLKSLQADIRRGIDGPRSVAGSLQDDLIQLRDILLTSRLT